MPGGPPGGEQLTEARKSSDNRGQVMTAGARQGKEQRGHGTFRRFRASGTPDPRNPCPPVKPPIQRQQRQPAPPRHNRITQPRMSSLSKLAEFLVAEVPYR